MVDITKLRTTVARVEVTLVLSVIAAVAAGVFTLAPVSQASQEFRFEPAGSAQSVGGDAMAVAPLGLARPAADALELQLPCAADGSRLRTAVTGDWLERRGSLSFAGRGNSLQVRLDDGRVAATSGGATLIELQTGGGDDCVATVGFEGGEWTATDGETMASEPGPGVRVTETAFTGPAASDPRSSVTVTTRELGTSPGLLQLLAAAVAVVALIGAAAGFVLRSGESGRPDRRDRKIRLVDIAVLGTLGMWAVLIPANIDDGWIADRLAAYPGHGDFSGLFTASAGRMPFGYWLEWLQHLWSQLGANPFAMRVFALLLGMATWAGLRSIGRSLGLPGAGGSIWLMATVFVMGFGAWGMTLRAEPMVAALVVASLAMALRFERGERGWVVVAWVGVLALALTAHPAGVIAFGPVAVVVPRWAAWWRSGRSARLAVLSAVLLLGASVVLLWTIDANLDSQRAAIDFARDSSHDDLIAEELGRYRLLDEAPYGTPMRRMTVGFAAIGVGAFLLRSRPGDRLRNLPAWSLIAGLLLLTLTPSKWPWHLGGLLGLIALVAAVELRLVERTRWVFVGLGTAAVASWAWSVSLPWTVFDVRTSQWAERDPVTGELLAPVSDALPFELTSLVGWAVLGGVVGLVTFAVRHLRPDLQLPTPPGSFALLVALLVVVITATTLWSDAAATKGWTFGRQNLDHALGRATCGLGDEFAVPVPGSLRPLPVGGSSDTQADLAARSAGFSDRGLYEAGGFFETDVNVHPPIAGATAVGSFVEMEGRTPPENAGRFISQWHALESTDDAVGLFIMGSFDLDSESELGNAVAIQWGAATEAGVADVGVEAAALSDVYIDWTFVEFLRPADATHVRLLLRDDTVRGGMAWVASTLPLGLSRAPLREVAADVVDSALVAPALGPYFPCLGVPQFDRGVVPVPSMVIQTWKEMWQTTFIGPASGERWFWYQVRTESPLEAEQVGAHTGDVRNFLFVSQEYLTGQPTRYTGSFEPVG